MEDERAMIGPFQKKETSGNVGIGMSHMLPEAR